jgi:hypothetical protein
MFLSEAPRMLRKSVNTDRPGIRGDCLREAIRQDAGRTLSTTLTLPGQEGLNAEADA